MTGGEARGEGRQGEARGEGRAARAGEEGKEEGAATKNRLYWCLVVALGSLNVKTFLLMYLILLALSLPRPAGLVTTLSLRS